MKNKSPRICLEGFTSSSSKQHLCSSCSVCSQVVADSDLSVFQHAALCGAPPCVRFRSVAVIKVPPCFVKAGF